MTHASQLVIAHETMCARQKQSSGVLFLDTRAAYYRVVREACYGIQHESEVDDCVCKVLKYFDLPGEAWTELLQLVREGGVLHHAGASEHVKCLADDLHRGSFFYTRYSSGTRICKTFAGSRPGESAADLIFGFIYSRVLRRIKERVAATSCTDPIGFDGQFSPWIGPETARVHVDQTTWADDSAFLARASTPDELLRRMQRLSAIVLDATKIHALDANLRAGKTEALIALRGPGSRKAAKAWFGTRGPMLRVETQLSGAAMIRVVASYVHLGFVIDRNATYGQESLRRLSIARKAFEDAKDLLLQNRAIPRRVRAQLFSALIESTMFNLEVWGDEAVGAWRKLRIGHGRLQRNLLGKEMRAEQLHKLSASELTLIVGVPALEVVLKCKRLRYLITLVRAAPKELWAVLKAEGTWLQALRRDMQWFCDHVGVEWPQPDEESWHESWHRLDCHPNRFRKLMRRAMESATLDSLHAGLDAETVDAMTAFQHGQDVGSQKRNLAEAGQALRCVPCSLPFCTKANLACHFRKVHGRAAPYRFYNGPVVCPGCATDYHSRNRIFMHLRDSVSCWRAAKQSGFVGNVEGPGIGSRAWRSDRHSNPVLIPPMPVEGPALLYDDGDDGDVLPAEKWSYYCKVGIGSAVDDWVANCSSIDDCRATTAALWDHVRHCCGKYPLFVEEYSEAILAVRREILLLHGTEFQWSQEILLFVLSLLEFWGTNLSYADFIGPLRYGETVPCSHATSPRSAPLTLTTNDDKCALWLGDDIRTEEGTRPRPSWHADSVKQVFIGWDLCKFREYQLETVSAIYICVDGAWEAVGAPRHCHGWGSTALDDWSTDPRLGRAHTRRLFNRMLAKAFKMYRCGCQGGVIVSSKASALLAASPCQLVTCTCCWQLTAVGHFQAMASTYSEA